MQANKKAILFTYYGPPVLTPFVEALERHGYNIKLIVTARGPNYAITPDAYESLGKQITAILDMWSHVPVLACTSVSQTKASITAIDPDLVVVPGFAYTITPDLLNLRAKWVNCHPAPLPLLAGAQPFIWPILRPDLYPIEKFVSTAHYMTPIIDDGPILKEFPLALEILPPDFSAEDVQKAAVNAMVAGADEIVRLAKEGYEGFAQTPLPEGYPKWARRLTDDQRTIKPEMTMDHAKRIFRAAFYASKTFFVYDSALYYVVRLSEATPQGSAMLESKSIGTARTGTSVLQKFADGGVLELSLRKL